ncbi:MAG TPA: hypothetical protein VIK69_00670 [Methylophilaceae bacterium]|jgi:hypothetical protein
MSYRTVFLFALPFTLGACSSLSQYNPFSEDKPAAVYKPANATEYQCDGNKQFFVRRLTKENAVWLIYPDREVRLEALNEASERYGNGIATLDIGSETASLTDGPAINYTNCRVVGNKG